MSEKEKPPFDPPYRTVRPISAEQVISVTQQSSTAGSLSTMSIVLGQGHVRPIVPEKPPGKPSIEIAPADHPIYSLVGRVASAWAHLEHALDLIIWDLSEIDPQRTACITAQMLGAGPRYKAVYSLLQQRNTDEFRQLGEEAKELMNKTFDHSEKRNRIIHDPWYVTNAKPAQFRAMPTKDPRFGVFEIDNIGIEAVIAAGNRLESQVSDLRVKILAALEASRKKSG